MKETVSLIPQVFYDLIGRVVPGAAALLGIALLLVEPGLLVKAVNYAVKKDPVVPVTILLFAGLLASYLLGALLGGLAFGFVEGIWQKIRPIDDGLSKIQANPPPPLQGSDIFDDIYGNMTEKENIRIRNARLSYIYDFIVLHDAAAGARLAKLRAESHMCRALMAGSILLIFAYVCENRTYCCDLQFWFVPIALIGVSVASYLLDTHLSVRTRSLTVNLWHLLNQHR